MNISQAERGGNGVSKRMVNQWLRRRGIALASPGIADFTVEMAVKRSLRRSMAGSKPKYRKQPHAK
jgi:hypothetical protein